MTQSFEQYGPAPFRGAIFHPTDLSTTSQTAFAHALAIALVGKTRLDIVHVGPRRQQQWSRFPSVRQTLERWGLLEPGSDRRAVYNELDLRIRKIRLEGSPVRKSLDYVRKSDPDLLVLGTRAGRRWTRWRAPLPAQAIARRSHRRTLFVPENGRVFVSPEDGHLSLRRILIPVDRSPNPAEALVEATRLAVALGDPPVQLYLLHLGHGEVPPCERPESDHWAWQELRREGPVDEQIAEVAESIEADLIVMATPGRPGLLRSLWGSATERVVRRANCPLLAVPAAN